MFHSVLRWVWTREEKRSLLLAIARRKLALASSAPPAVGTVGSCCRVSLPNALAGEMEPGPPDAGAAVGSQLTNMKPKLQKNSSIPQTGGPIA